MNPRDALHIFLLVMSFKTKTKSSESKNKTVVSLHLMQEMRRHYVRIRFDGVIRGTTARGAVLFTPHAAHVFRLFSQQTDRDDAGRGHSAFG